MATLCRGERWIMFDAKKISILPVNVCPVAFMTTSGNSNNSLQQVRASVSKLAEENMTYLPQWHCCRQTMYSLLR